MGRTENAPWEEAGADPMGMLHPAPMGCSAPHPHGRPFPRLALAGGRAARRRVHLQLQPCCPQGGRVLAAWRATGPQCRTPPAPHVLHGDGAHLLHPDPRPRAPLRLRRQHLRPLQRLPCHLPGQQQPRRLLPAPTAPRRTRLLPSGCPPVPATRRPPGFPLRAGSGPVTLPTPGALAQPHRPHALAQGLRAGGEPGALQGGRDRGAEVVAPTSPAAGCPSPLPRPARGLSGTPWWHRQGRAHRSWSPAAGSGRAEGPGGAGVGAGTWEGGGEPWCPSPYGDPLGAALWVTG